MAGPGNLVREISWREVFPWLLIGQAARASLQIQTIGLASLGLLLTWAGWSISGLIWYGQAPDCWLSAALGDWAPAAPTSLPSDGLPVTGAVAVFRPLLTSFTQWIPSTGWSGVAVGHLITSATWAVLIWALVGGILGRLAAFELGLEEPGRLTEATRHGLRYWWTYLRAPFLPLSGAALLGLFVTAVSLLLQWEVGVLIASVLYPLVLVSAAVMAILIVGTVFGWPLMWATISVDRGDGFEGFARSFGYLSQRPLSLGLYTLLGGLVGLATAIVILGFVCLTIGLTLGCAQFAENLAGPGHTAAVLAHCPPPVQGIASWWGFSPQTESAGTIGFLGSGIVAVWLSLAYLVFPGFLAAYFWTASIAVYLVIRQTVDQTEFDDVRTDRPRATRQLPPLKPAADGLPTVEITLPRTAGPAEPPNPAEPTQTTASSDEANS